MKQDLGGKINPTMNGRGPSVLIWGRTCRTLLGDKGKPISGEKGTRTNKRKRIWIEFYMRTDWIEVPIVRAVSGKWMILRKKIPRVVLCHRLTIFGSTLNDSFFFNVEEDYWILHILERTILHTDYLHLNTRKKYPINLHLCHLSIPYQILISALITPMTRSVHALMYHISVGTIESSPFLLSVLISFLVQAIFVVSSFHILYILHFLICPRRL